MFVTLFVCFLMRAGYQLAIAMAEFSIETTAILFQNMST